MLLLVIFMIMTWSYGDVNTLCYAALYVTFIIILLKGWLTSHKVLLSLCSFDILPLPFILVWIYGFILGFALGNPTVGVIRNFAGMAMYLLYYVFVYKKITRESLLRTVFLAGIINMLVAVVFSLMYYNALVSVSLWKTQSGVARILFSSSLFVTYVIVSVIGTSYLVRKNDYELYFSRKKIPYVKSSLGRLAVFLGGVYACAMVSGSKGFIIGFVFLVIVIPAALFAKDIFVFRINKKILTYCMFLTLLTATFFAYGYNVLLMHTFDSNEVSNQERLVQSQYIYDDLTFFGKGLGAGLDSGYSRDELDYGFEVSFLNVIHKFGVFSLVLFYVYGYTIIKALKNLYRREDIKYSSAVLGAMCYLFPSIGNPALFCPVASVLHCIALYWLRPEKQKHRLATEC